MSHIYPTLIWKDLQVAEHTQVSFRSMSR